MERATNRRRGVERQGGGGDAFSFCFFLVAVSGTHPVPPPSPPPPFSFSFTRIGVLTFLCHDVNDIFLESAKLARYARRPVAPTALFVAFAVSWVVSRLIYFPAILIRSAAVMPASLIAVKYEIDPHPHWSFFVGFLSFLLCLHAYWSVLIARVVAKTLRAGQPDDVREESEEDSD